MFEGFVLGILTFLGFWAVYKKLPEPLKKVISHPKLAWITDILLTVGSYILLSGISGSLGSAIGCAIAGISVSIYLELQGDKKWRKPPLSNQ